MFLRLNERPHDDAGCGGGSTKPLMDEMIYDWRATQLAHHARYRGHIDLFLRFSSLTT